MIDGFNQIELSMKTKIKILKEESLSSICSIPSLLDKIDSHTYLGGSNGLNGI